MTTLVNVPNLIHQRANRVVARPNLAWEVWIDNTDHTYDLPGTWVLFANTGSFMIAEIVIENELNRRFGDSWFCSESKSEYQHFQTRKTLGRIKGAR